MAFYSFFKVGWIYDEITVDHGLEVTPRPKVARIQVGESRRSICWNLPADDSNDTEMVAEHLYFVEEYHLALTL